MTSPTNKTSTDRMAGVDGSGMATNMTARGSLTFALTTPVWAMPRGVKPARAIAPTSNAFRMEPPMCRYRLKCPARSTGSEQLKIQCTKQSEKPGGGNSRARCPFFLHAVRHGTWLRDDPCPACNMKAANYREAIIEFRNDMLPTRTSMTNRPRIHGAKGNRFGITVRLTAY